MASVNSLTTSPWPFIQGLLLTEKSVVFVGHRQKPVLCFATSIA